MAPKSKITLSSSELEQLYTKLGSKGLVAKYLGVSSTTVMRALRKHNIKMKEPPAKKLFATKNELRVIYNKLGGMQLVARHYGVSKKLILKYMDRYGLVRTDDRKPAQRMADAKGYVLIYCPNHPFCTKIGYVFEHRLAMEKHLQRYLTEDEIVHHDDEVVTNNCIKNLEVMTRSEHMALHRKRQLAKL